MSARVIKLDLQFVAQSDKFLPFKRIPLRNSQL